MIIINLIIFFKNRGIIFNQIKLTDGLVIGLFCINKSPSLIPVAIYFRGHSASRCA
jgi:hypothetical protein